MYRAAFLLVCLWSGALAAQEAGAEPVPPSGTADAIFEAGVRAMERQDWIAAEVLFRQAYELEPSARVRLNLGQSLYEQDELLSARVEASAVVHGDDLLLQDAAQGLLEQIDAAIGSLTLRVRTLDPEDARFRVDGGEVDATRPIRLDPGEHRVALFDDDRLVAEESVTIGRGQATELVLGPDLSPEGAAMSGEPPQLLGGEEARAKRRRRWGFGIAAGVVVVLAVALGLGFGLGGNDEPSGDVAPLVFELGP